jgi:hypothetical protein
MASVPDSRLAKSLGALLLVFGAAIAIVPQYTKCRDAMAVCHTTARWEIVAGGAIVALAVAVIFTRRRLRLAAAVAAAGVSALSIALPTSLTGLCTDPMMRCQMYLKPTSILLGVGALVVSVLVVGLAAAAERQTSGVQREA